MRKTIITVISEIVALLVSIFLLETLGFLDFFADGAYDAEMITTGVIDFFADGALNVELITARLHITMVLGGLLVIVPPLLSYLGFKRDMKSNIQVDINKALKSMLFSSLRGCAYFLIISQWNVFVLKEYISHC